MNFIQWIRRKRKKYKLSRLTPEMRKIVQLYDESLLRIPQIHMEIKEIEPGKKVVWRGTDDLPKI